MTTPATYSKYLRQDLCLGDDQVVGDIEKLVAEDCKYDYAEKNFGDAFSAFTQSLGNDRFLICFNTDHDWGNAFKRFTIAHELGHLSIPAHRKILETKILHRSMAEYSSQDVIEREADLFAINFLAPEESFASLATAKDFSKKNDRYCCQSFWDFDLRLYSKVS